MSSNEEVIKEVHSEAQREPAQPKKMKLLSSDGEEFELEPSLAMQSSLIKDMLEDGRAENGPLHLPDDVMGPGLAMVVDYWKRHAGGGEKLEGWDAEFVSKMNMDSLLAVIAAAYHLKCKPLAMLTCQALLHIIKDFSNKEVLDRFGIELSFTAEEKREFQEQNPWFFE